MLGNNKKSLLGKVETGLEYIFTWPLTDKRKDLYLREIAYRIIFIVALAFVVLIMNAVFQPKSIDAQILLSAGIALIFVIFWAFRISRRRSRLQLMWDQKNENKQKSTENNEGLMKFAESLKKKANNDQK